MKEIRTLPMLLLLLSAASVMAVDSSDSDDSVVPSHSAGEVQTSMTIEGEFPDERFLSFQRGKVFRVLLDGGKQQAIVRNDGSFSIYDVTEGVHTLEVDAPEWHFEQVKLDVHYRGTQLKVRATYNGENGGSKVLKYPLHLEPTGKFKYFEEREKFDITVYLKNPMVVMGLVAAFMAFIMPKMVENLDPEERKRLQEDMKKVKINPAIAAR